MEICAERMRIIVTFTFGYGVMSSSDYFPVGRAQGESAHRCDEMVYVTLRFFMPNAPVGDKLLGV